MDRPLLSMRNMSFDGPGARPILADAGPSRNLTSSQCLHSSRETAEWSTSARSSSSNATVSPDAASSSSVSTRRVGGKANVSTACGPCKRAHLACDVARPCRRCVSVGRVDQCRDVPVSFALGTFISADLSAQKTGTT